MLSRPYPCLPLDHGQAGRESMPPDRPGVLSRPLYCGWRTRMLGTRLDVRPFLERVAQELARIDPAEVKALADAIYECYQKRRLVFLCGNGGSGSNASHFCED